MWIISSDHDACEDGYMARYLIAGLVVVIDVAVYVGGHPSWRDASLYALAVVAVVLLWQRSALAAFVAALVLTSFTEAGYVLLIWAAYQAGRAAVSRSGTVIAVGAAIGALGGQLAFQSPRGMPFTAAVFLVFVALPLLAGRYLAQHERLVSTLERLAEQERLRERLRIARDMHDSLGRRLSLVSVQAAALEVSELSPSQRETVGRLAQAARDAMDELHDLVGTMRAPDSAPIADLIEAFRAAGVTVDVTVRGIEGSLPEAAYRVAEEGLTNAAKHAPGQPVTVELTWEPDALLVTVANPVVHAGGINPGYGLSGLDERVRQAGGFVDYRMTGTEFRLTAMFPAAPEPGRVRTAVLGFATATLMFVLLPATMLVGVAP